MTPISENTCPYTPPTADDASESTAATPGVMAEAANLLSSVHSAVAHSLDLLAMETRRASLSLTWMIALGLVMGLLVVSVWFGLMAVLALSVVAWGLSWIAAILILVVINLCAAFVVAYMCINMSKDLLFSASRRQFANRLVAQSSSV